MKKKMNKFYFIIPLIYILVIVLFFIFHFTGRDSFESTPLGYLSIKGAKSRAAFYSKQKIVELYAQFGGFKLFFSGDQSVVLEYENGKREMCEIDTYSIFEKNIEIRYINGLVVSIFVGGDFGTRALITIEELPSAFMYQRLIIPFAVEGKEIEINEDLPVLSCTTSHERFFLSLP